MATPNRRTPDALRKRLRLHIHPDPLLRQDCTAVELFDKPLQSFGARMATFMQRVKGIGLAAPQVGVLCRVVAVGIHDLHVCLVNPQVIPITTDCDTKMEGCLSLPDRSYVVSRYFQIEVEARDVAGKKLHFVADGLLARVIQHEVDHLDGVLICDKEAKTGCGRDTTCCGREVPCDRPPCGDTQR
jgi:peptide deformylase